MIFLKESLKQWIIPASISIFIMAAGIFLYFMLGSADASNQPMIGLPGME